MATADVKHAAACSRTPLPRLDADVLMTATKQRRSRAKTEAGEAQHQPLSLLLDQ